MYSLVLMAAMTAGGETPDFCFRGCRGGWGCHGCYSCSGCYGCSGGYGGGHGCCSYGYGCHGGYVGGYGYCYGGGYIGCHGCYGCYGCGGCYGCYGGGSACAGGYGCVGFGHTMIGCYSAPGYGYNPVPLMGGAVPMVPGAGGPPADLPPGDGKPADPKKDKQPDMEVSAKARLVVEVPGDAKVYIDDQLMKTKEGVRKYSTPTLEPGQLYYYMVKAEIVRDGKTQSETKRVVVKAGEESRLSFDKLEPVATAKADR